MKQQNVIDSKFEKYAQQVKETYEKLKRKVYEELEEKCLDKSGAVLYSSYHTLRPGFLYILGLNPGGDPEKQKDQTIRKDLEKPEKFDPDYTAYVTEKWRPTGFEPLQKNIQLITTEIFGIEPKYICSSNLFFVRTRSEEELDNEIDSEEKIMKFWRIHEFIIDEFVKPSVIVTFSNKVFYFLKEKIYINKNSSNDSEKSERYVKYKFSFPSFHANWDIKALVVHDTYKNKKLAIVNFPHLSRYRLHKLAKSESDKLYMLKQWIENVIAMRFSINEPFGFVKVDQNSLST